MKVEVSQTIKLAIEQGGTNFTSELIKLIAKADKENLQRLKMAFPVQVTAWEAWYNSVDGIVPEHVEISDEMMK